MNEGPKNLLSRRSDLKTFFPSKQARRSDLIAFAFLVSAVVAFGLFQGLAASYSQVGYGGEEEWEAYRGCQVWGEALELMRSPAYVDLLDWVIYAGLFMSVLLVIGSPFFIGVLSRSRLMWWTATMSSGIAMCGLVGALIILIADNPTDADWHYGPGMGALLVYPVLNFVGLLWVRRRKPEAGIHP